MTNCHDAPVTVQGITEELSKPVYSLGKGICESQIWSQRPFRGNIMMLNGSSFFRPVTNGKLMIFKASLYHMNKTIEAKDLKERPLEKVVPKEYHEF